MDCLVLNLDLIERTHAHVYFSIGGEKNSNRKGKVVFETLFFNQTAFLHDGGNTEIGG